MSEPQGVITEPDFIRFRQEVGTCFYDALDETRLDWADDYQDVFTCIPFTCERVGGNALCCVAWINGSTKYAAFILVHTKDVEEAARLCNTLGESVNDKSSALSFMKTYDNPEACLLWEGHYRDLDELAEMLCVFAVKGDRGG